MAAIGTKKVGKDLTEGPILRKLVPFVLPIVLANLVQQLYGLVDLIVIGKFMGPTGTVGVSVGGEINDVILPLAGAFASAGQILIAQLVGARAEKKKEKAIGTLLSLMLFAGLFIMVVVLVLHSVFLKLLSCPPEAYGQAVSYMVITAFGIPFVMMYNAVCGVLRGMGESNRPFIFICIAAAANIVMDIILVVPFHMEAAGTAIATLISQIASFAAAFIFMYQRREHFGFKLSLSYLKIDGEALKIILKLGIPQAVRSMFVRFSMFYVNSSINSYGLVVSATNSVGNKLMSFLELYSSSFMSACSAMVGQNLGAKKPDRALKMVWYSLGITMAIAAVAAALLFFFPSQMYGIFTSDPAVIEMGHVYIQMLMVHLFFSAFISPLQGVVLGSGNSILNFIIGIIDGVICKVGFGVILAYVFDMGYLGFWWGTAFSRAIPGLICLIYVLSGKWKNRSLFKESPKEAET